MSKIGRLSNEEIDNIRLLLQQGESIWKISIITERSEYTIRNIRREMMQEEEKQKEEKPEEPKQEEPKQEEQSTINSDTRACLKKYWHWKIPEKKQQPVKRRSGNFRTPYTQPKRFTP